MLEITIKSVKSIMDTRLPALFVNDKGKKDVISKVPEAYAKYF